MRDKSVEMSDNANKMRDRLVELIKEELCITTVFNGEFIEAAANIEEVADYLLANGAVALPCKVGDRVWAIRKYKGVSHPQESVVSDMYFTRNMELMIVVKYVARGIWGKTVFRTKEEAERAFDKVKKNRNNCVDCDECSHRSEDCLCDISDNDDECPLLNLKDGE